MTRLPCLAAACDRSAVRISKTSTKRLVPALTRWLLALLLVLLAGLVSPQPCPVEAQHTGGSFGGGHFGGGGGHSYGGGGGSYGGGSHYYGGGLGLHGHRGSCTSFGFSLTLFIVIMILKASLAGRSRSHDHLPPRHESLTHSSFTSFAPLVDVSAIHLALSFGARPALQKRLEALAQAGHTSTPGGLAYLLHETVIELRRVESSWLYAGAVNALPTQAAQAERHFRSIASEMRSRFKVETVRAVDGRVVSTNAPELRARPEEGAGLVLVTLIVAATRELPDITKAADARELRGLLRKLGSLNARDMVALEVIWSPSADNDRMSSAELEVLYPELRRMDENTVVGRVFCGYCAQPFPAELLRCPSCGAPGTEAKRCSA